MFFSTSSICHISSQAFHFSRLNHIALHIGWSNYDSQKVSENQNESNIFIGTGYFAA